MKSIMLVVALLFSGSLFANDKGHHCYECKEDHKHHYSTKDEAMKHCAKPHEVKCSEEHHKADHHK